MAEVVVYLTRSCSYCVRARQLLTSKGVAFTEVGVDLDPVKRAEMQRLSGRSSVPQIFIDGRPIGGFAELWTLETSGELDKLLGQTTQR